LQNIKQRDGAFVITLRHKGDTAFYSDQLKLSPKYLEVWKIVPIFAASEMTNPVFSAWG
jgi:hypothetical protein